MKKSFNQHDFYQSSCSCRATCKFRSWKNRHSLNLSYLLCDIHNSWLPTFLHRMWIPISWSSGKSTSQLKARLRVVCRPLSRISLLHLWHHTLLKCWRMQKKPVLTSCLHLWRFTLLCGAVRNIFISCSTTIGIRKKKRREGVDNKFFYIALGKY